MTLRARSRDLTRNTWFGARATAIKTTNTIGTGIRPSIAGENPRLERRLRDWKRSTDLDADGLHNYGGIQALAYRTKVESGGAFIRRFISGGQLRLQVLEPDWVDHTYSQRLEGDKFVIQGVQFDARGRREGYHFLTEHPGALRHSITDQNREFVPADDCIHLYDVLRPGQVRGVPATTPILIAVKDWSDYEDAQLMRQKIAACFTAFVSADAGGRAGLPEPESGDGTDENGEIVGRVQPGMIMKMRPGEEITFGQPPDVEGYRDFASVKLHELAAGLNVTYEALTGDYSEVNYSSARMGRLQSDAHIKKQQQHLVIPRMLHRIEKWWLDLERVQGFATEEDRWEHTAPVREMIDPAKETDAQIRSIRAGLSSRQDEIRRRGREPEQVYDEMQQDNDAADQRDLILDTDPRKQNANGTPRRDATQEPQDAN